MSNVDIAGSIVKAEKPRRELGDELREQLMTISKDNPVIVSSVLGDAEAFEFASEITAFLASHGYNVKGVNRELYTQPVRAQILDIQPARTLIVIGFQM